MQTDKKSCKKHRMHIKENNTCTSTENALSANYRLKHYQDHVSVNKKENHMRTTLAQKTKFHYIFQGKLWPTEKMCQIFVSANLSTKQ